MTDVHRIVGAMWRQESARIVGGLLRMVHDVGLAEELAQDAVVAALEQWPATGVPDNPGAWLTTVAKRRAVDHIRRSQRLDRRHQQLAHDLEHPAGEQPDDVLRLLIISCHPVLPADARIALTLRVVAGLTAAESGRAFLVGEPVIAQQIAAATRTLAAAEVPFGLTSADEVSHRLASVLEVIYLVFNEGYSATTGDDLLRPDLCREALRLGRLLAGLAPGASEVHGLVALMEIQASRSAARTGPAGEPVPLHAQNRGRWDPLLIRRGFTALLRAREIGGPAGPYVLQAAIAACHARARSADDTDWAQIAGLYGALARVLPTPVVQLNRAVAVGMADGGAAGLALVDTLLTDPRLADYHLLPGVRGDLLLRLGRRAEAQHEFARAAALARNAAERGFLRRRADEIDVRRSAGLPLGDAVRAFLARDEPAASTVRAYAQTLRRLCRAVGDEVPLPSLTADQVTRAFGTAWPAVAPRTWNRHVAAVRSFATWAGLPGLTAGLDRRTATGPPPGRADARTLDDFLRRTDVPVRERTLWHLLRESAAPVGAVLALDVEHLDLDDRRARAGRTWVTWRRGTAELLPVLIGDRARGPLFLAGRRPGPSRTPAAADLCPETGRRRLSYERAEYLFKQATTSLDPAGHGWTLRQLRPAPGSHLGS